MKKILFVCTGNTCRSPMAQAAAEHMAKEKGIKALFASAGLYATGEDTSNNARVTLGLAGIDFCKRSEQLTKKLADEADVIYGITQSHAENVRRAFPKAAHKVKSFPRNISDPYGGDIAVYKRCYEEICKGLEAIFEAEFPEGV